MNLVQDSCLIACTHFNCRTQTVNSKLINHLELILYPKYLPRWVDREMVQDLYSCGLCISTMSWNRRWSWPRVIPTHLIQAFLAVILGWPNLNWNSDVDQNLTLKPFVFSIDCRPAFLGDILICRYPNHVSYFYHWLLSFFIFSKLIDVA